MWPAASSSGMAGWQAKIASCRPAIPQHQCCDRKLVVEEDSGCGAEPHKPMLSLQLVYGKVKLTRRIDTGALRCTHVVGKRQHIRVKAVLGPFHTISPTK